MAKRSKPPLNERIRYQLGTIERQGIRTYVKGLARKAYYIRLRKRYGFDPWHLSPYELRPYATDVVRAINAMPGSRSFTICEIGCGLGDIIRNIVAEHKYGYDISPNAIDCAKHLGGRVRYSVGSFEDAAGELPASIDVLIAVCWVHILPPEELKKQFDILLGAVDVKRIVIDVIENERPHPSIYRHNLDELFPEYARRYLTKDGNGEAVFARVYVLEKG